MEAAPLELDPATAWAWPIAADRPVGQLRDAHAAVREGLTARVDAEETIDHDIGTGSADGERAGTCRIRCANPVVPPGLA